MTVFNKFARTFKSHWLLYLCVIVFGITNLVAYSGAHMVQRLLFFVLTILVVKRISSLPLRLLVAAPFVLLTAADMSISLYSWCTFGTTFNDGFAISVLQSDPDEVVKMLARIELQGRRPRTVKDWSYLYESIKRSVWLEDEKLQR